MTKFVLVAFLFIQFCSSRNPSQLVSKSVLPKEDSTVIQSAETNSDSLWWGIWELDSMRQGGETFRMQPMYYYFLPDKRCFYLPGLKDSVSDLKKYKNKNEFYVRQDSMFIVNNFFETARPGETGHLEFVFYPVSQRQKRISFPNGNTAWIKQIFLAKKGEDSFIRIEE